MPPLLLPSTRIPPPTSFFLCHFASDVWVLIEIHYRVPCGSIRRHRKESQKKNKKMKRRKVAARNFELKNWKLKKKKISENKRHKKSKCAQIFWGAG